MIEREPITDVVFRRWPKREGGDVIALFPLVPESEPGTCSCYQHLGQHGAAAIRLSMDTLPAREGEADVAELKRELEGLGYRLRVLMRMPNWRKVDASRREAGL